MINRAKAALVERPLWYVGLMLTFGGLVTIVLLNSVAGAELFGETLYRALTVVSLVTFLAGFMLAADHNPHREGS